MNNEILKIFKNIKIFLVFSIFLLIHSIIFFTIYNFETKNEISYIKETSKHILQQQRLIIKTNIENIKSDLTLLANANVIDKYITDKKNYKKQIQKQFKVFASKKGIYDQIRFINSNGLEEIRVNYKNKLPIIVDDKNLQNKSDRYYFSKTIVMSKNDIYISQFDLNIEKGVIEKPIKPMVRFGTPIYDGEKKVGIIVLNYLGQNLLNQLSTSFKFFAGNISIIDNNGYWLLNKDKYKEWGYAYPEKKDFTFRNEYQDASRYIYGTNEGEIETKNGYFFHSTFFDFDTNHIKIVLNIDKKIINTIKSNNIKVILPIYIVTFILGIVFISLYFWILQKQKFSEEKLSLMSLVFKNSKEGIIITDEKSNILEINNSFIYATGYTQDEIVGKNPSVLQSGWHDEEFYRNMWDKIEKYGFFEGEVTNRRKNGESYLEWLRIYRIKNNSGNVTNYIGIFSDITKQKETENEIYRLAHYDTLTRLPNRHLFNQNLAEIIDEANQNHTKVALLFIDLDNFKYINDAFGHYIGDKFLQKVAKRIENIINKKDMTARLGGDEFVVIVNNYESDQYIKNITKNIISSLTKPFSISNEDIFTSASIGISVFPQDAQNKDELIKHADMAMYIAKRNGKNNYQIFDKNSDENTHERFSIETMLHTALDNNEFVLFFQPQVDIINNKVVAFEALIRWNTPNKGIISPDKFIPIAEETGLIHSIGEWILEESFIMLKSLHVRGNQVNGSINLSIIQLKNTNIVNKIINLIEKHSIRPENIKLEITESVLMEDIDEFILILNKLSDLGFKISIDDFGTGYSSLNYLKRLPIDELKIDKSFIQDILIDKNDTQIVSAIISIAKALELKIVAEGVEHKEEVELLRELGCDKIQGYYFSKPLKKDDFLNYIDNFK
jgi:diguanylate cyclase (GGDEF)-like protein/PAS domain S-box-containing protein